LRAYVPNKTVRAAPPKPTIVSFKNWNGLGAN
jgi:hypothetical protein